MGQGYDVVIGSDSWKQGFFLIGIVDFLYEVVGVGYGGQQRGGGQMLIGGFQNKFQFMKVEI